MNVDLARVLCALFRGCLSLLMFNGEIVAQNNIFWDNDSSFLAFEQKICEASDDSLNKLKAYYEYGEFLDEAEKYELAIPKFVEALRIAKNIKNHAEIATVANYLANVYAVVGDFNASNESYLLALENAEKAGDAGEIAKISMNLATNYNFTGDYDKAIEFGLFALKTKESNNNLVRICYHYVSVGNIFKEVNNIGKWREYIMKAYRMKDVDGCASFSDIAKIYNGLGGIAEQEKEFEKALCYYDTLLSLCKKNNNLQGTCTALINSADIYRQLDSIPKALELIAESEKYFGENPYDEIFNDNFKALLYQLSGEYQEALELAENNIKRKEIECYSTEKLKCLELLYELNVSLHQYPEAFAWNDSLRKIENELRDEEVRKNIEELETKYQTEKKEQQIELLTTENELKNQRLRAGVILLVVLVFVVFLVLYILQIRRKQAKLVQNDLQQKVLRSQMNPHFIFNVLGSIQNFLLSNDNKKAAKYLSQFASLTRATLEYSASDTISLTNEISMLENYMELEKMRAPEKFSFEIVTSEELESDFIQIPPMMIQPFVENAIKHGFSNIDYPGVITVSISDQGQWVEFVIEDNGKGMGQESTSSHRSMAMEIFEKRRKLIQQKHKKEFTFELTNLCDYDSAKSGVKVSINVPVFDYD